MIIDPGSRIIHNFMKRGKIFSIIFVCILGAILIVSGCDKLPFSSGTKGNLTGVISIGPICPVETDPPNPACLPTAETYKAYPVSVFTENGHLKLLTLTPALDGTYAVKLSSGRYIVVLERDMKGVGGSNLPVTVTITPDENTLLDINIDTGIR
jgi:hypothetical protein